MPPVTDSWAKRLVAGVTLAMILLAMTSTPANANYFGYNPGCCRFADNGNHGFNQDSTVSYNDAALDNARSVLFGETDMTTFYDTSVDSSTDLVSYDQYYTDYWGLDWDGSTTGYNYYAYTKCVNQTLGGECDRNEARFDLADTDQFSTAERRSLALHEMGHSLGLDHSTASDSFMQTGRHTIVHFSTHDKNHINGRW
jgi:hypothetical protein